MKSSSEIASCFITDVFKLDAFCEKRKKASDMLFQDMLGQVRASATCMTGAFSIPINPLVTNGLSRPYHLDESTFIYRDTRIDFSFFDEIHVNKQNSPRRDAAFCGVTSGSILFAYVP